MTNEESLQRPSVTDQFGRTRLTIAEFASRLDHRLYDPDLQRADLAAGCRYALEHGLAAVICRPEHVPLVARHLEGTRVGIVTALAFEDGNGPGVSDPDDLMTEACRLIEQGATELAVVASAAEFEETQRRSFEEGLTRLLTLQDIERLRVRVHLDAKGFTDEELQLAARSCSEAGVWMVQAGSWANPRAAFRSLLLIRATVGPNVLLKWTTPVPSIHVMLLAIAEGVDRFNGDVEELLRKFTREASHGPVSVPLKGVDY